MSDYGVRVSDKTNDYIDDIAQKLGTSKTLVTDMILDYVQSQDWSDEELWEVYRMYMKKVGPRKTRGRPKNTGDNSDH